MKKTEFVRSLAEATGITIKQAGVEVDPVFDHVVTVAPQLADGEKLDITGIIQFEAKDVPARKGRNPQTGEEIDLDATRKINVRAMKNLKEAVKANIINAK